jgi:hypothetical protein
MEESDLNTMIKNSLEWGTKIPDPGASDAMTTSKRAFDGFGIGSSGIVYFESKFQKDYSAFNFTRVYPHQIQNLVAIADLALKYNYKEVKSLLFLGVWIPRQELVLFAFTAHHIASLITSGKKSLLKKELLGFREQGLYLQACKQIFPMSQLQEVIIGRSAPTAVGFNCALDGQG